MQDSWMVDNLSISNFSMKKKILIILSVILSIFVVDFFVGYISEKLILGLPNAGTLFANNKYALMEAKPELLILGSSRANHHYDTKILSDSLGLDCYNGGIDGHGMPMSFCIFKSVIERKKPKIIILDIWKTMLLDKHMDDLRCFYRLNKYVKSIIDINNSNNLIEQTKYESSLYLYNSTLPRILQSYAIGEVIGPGYIASPQKRNDSLHLRNDTVDVVYDSLCISLLNDIIRECKSKRILLVMVMSPSLDVQRNNFMKFTKEISSKEDVVLLDYNDDTRFTSHTEFFNDQVHMNVKGAELFSQDLANRILCLLKYNIGKDEYKN